MAQGRGAAAAAPGRVRSVAFLKNPGGFQAANITAQRIPAARSPSRRFHEDTPTRSGTQATLRGRPRDAGEQFGPGALLHDKLLHLKQQSRFQENIKDLRQSAAIGDATARANELRLAHESSVVKRIARGCKDPALRLRCREAAAQEPLRSAATIFSANGEYQYQQLKARVLKAVKSPLPPDARDNISTVPTMNAGPSVEALEMQRAVRSIPEAQGGKKKGMLPDDVSQKRVLGADVPGKPRRSERCYWKKGCMIGEMHTARRAAQRSAAAAEKSRTAFTSRSFVQPNQMFKPMGRENEDVKKGKQWSPARRTNATVSSTMMRDDRMGGSVGQRTFVTSEMFVSREHKRNESPRPTNSIFTSRTLANAYEKVREEGRKKRLWIS